MKTSIKFKILCAIFSTSLCFAQHESSKLSECKSLTIQLFQGNTSAGEPLTKCLVSLASECESAMNSYNEFSKNIALQTKEALADQLISLEAQKESAKKMKENAQSAMINNVSQNIINQSNSYAKPNAKTQQNIGEKCVNRPGYGCTQQ